MRRRSWLDDAAKRRFAETIAAIEAKTSAEVVVTVRERSASYRHVDLAMGSLFALVVLVTYVYAPLVFDDALAVPSVVLAFVGGALLGSALDRPKRLLVGADARKALVLTAARAAFVEQGISVTRDRTGILVYVSLLENAVAVVPDIGVDPRAMGEAWTTVLSRLERCAAEGAPPSAFAEALLALGEPRYRADQIHKWIFGRGARSLDAMTDAPKALRRKLEVDPTRPRHFITEAGVGYRFCIEPL